MGLWQRLGRTVRPGKLDQDIAEEMQHHLAMRAGEGKSAREVRLRFGPPERIGAEAHERDVVTWLESCLQDLRHAGRMLRRSPGFTAVVVISLALGIGANAAIFSLVNAVLLKTLPVPEPQQIVLLGQKGNGMGSMPLLSYPLVQEMAASGRAEGVEVGAASGANDYRLGPNETGPAVASLQLVTGGYFSGLEIKPALGRWINDSDTRAVGASPVVVVGYGFWQKQLGGAVDVIGRTIELRSVKLTIVGVAPRGFTGLNPANPADVWAPVTMQAVLHAGGSRMSVNGDDSKPWTSQEQIAWLAAYARMPRPGSAARLQGEWNGLLAQSWKRIAPDATPMTLTMSHGASGDGQLRLEYGGPLRMLMALAALMLLIAIANVATLLLARTVRRRREIAVRLAVGISSGRLARQLVTEGVLLAALAGAAAVALALWLSGFLVRLAGAGDGVPFQPDLDWRVWVLLAGVALVTGVVLGLLPAWQAKRGRPAEDLKSEAGQASGGKHVPLGRWLVIAQVALSLLLVAGAGLFARNLAGMFHVNLGFQPDHLLSAELLLPPGTDLPLAASLALEQRLLRQARAIPGVTTAALSDNGLDANSNSNSGIVFPDDPNPKEKPRAEEDTVTRSFFGTVGMNLVRGRGFDPTDTAHSPAVVVVNQAFARAHYAGRDPMGQTFGYDRDSIGKFRIIGVVADARVNDPHKPAVPMFYHLADQVAGVPLRLVVRTAGSPSAMAAPLRAAIATADPGLRVFSIVPVRERVSRLLSRDKLVAQLSGGFGLLALLLACLGVYGVMAYAVAARTSEFGLRMALGATRGGVLGLVLGETARLLAIGAVIGVGLVLLCGRWVQPLLHGGVATADPVTLAAAIAVMIVLPLLAAAIPGWRAARADPAQVLRR